jgi:hypothetical protein
LWDAFSFIINENVFLGKRACYPMQTVSYELTAVALKKTELSRSLKLKSDVKYTLKDLQAELINISLLLRRLGNLHILSS